MDVLGYQAGVVAPVICERLLDHCLNKNSKDNMSVCLVVLPGAPSAIPGYDAARVLFCVMVLIVELGVVGLQHLHSPNVSLQT